HKEAIMAFGEPDHVSRLVGAGNTLVTHHGDSAGVPTVHNTDVPGFVRAWRAHGLGVPESAAIVGNGATARSLLVALAGLHVRRVVILARDPSRASSAVDLGIALGIDTTVQPLSLNLGNVDVLANTIPAAATAPFAQSWADAARWIFDVVYSPWPTPLGAAATDEHTVLSGLDLLAGQAVDQFHLLTGGEITFEQAHAAAVAELKRRTGTPRV
ncbi:MAG: shikimate dehydrogenase family protein, partial [Arachnia sp.]